QCVLISVWIRSLPVASSTARIRSAACAASPPSTISAPSSPRIATTFAPAPWSRTRPPRSVVVIRPAASCARAASAGNSAPPSETAPAAPRKRRRESRALFMSRVRVDRRMDARLADGPDVGPDALRRAEDGPHRRALHLFGRAELAEQRRLLG